MLSVYAMPFYVFQRSGETQHDMPFVFVVRMGFLCVVLWRPEALDCGVLIPAETWSWLTRNPPSLGFEPRTSCMSQLHKLDAAHYGNSSVVL